MLMLASLCATNAFIFCNRSGGPESKNAAERSKWALGTRLPALGHPLEVQWGSVCGIHSRKPGGMRVKCPPEQLPFVCATV